ncbi:MAG: type II toxin-antitoxin system VapC family toxin [Burkholderiales bacterium]
MVAVDTNLLVYAYRADAPFHERARSLLEGLAQGMAPWSVPWPCVHEFIAVVTNARIFRTPTPIDAALTEIRKLAALSHVSLLAEGEGYLEKLEPIAMRARVQGGAIHDARIAAICLYHGVSELWSADRDFTRFPVLSVRNPLTE